ncbi:hypothetical protein ACJ72_02621 [Emergomyces africanus]|uniref:Uncharacterized protein n=1 Tax=Emergomyces africanus TaxID=1955775 RepID=A0A1B7P1X8_9EURO|nr:hypothetical protein ACJ72_02621 [Emergomyces africanus]
MAPRSQLVGLDDKEGLSKSDAGSTLDAIFLDSRYESGPNSSLGEDDNDSDDSDGDIFDDEGQLSAEHYLVQVKSLNVTQLQQK